MPEEQTPVALSSDEVSCAMTLQRWRPAIEVFFGHDQGKQATLPNRILKDWKAWAARVREELGGGRFTRAYSKNPAGTAAGKPHFSWPETGRSDYSKTR